MHIDLPSIEDARRAQQLLRARGLSSAVTEVLIPSHDAAKTVYLKHECDLPLGSYKLRGVLSALGNYDKQHQKNPDRLITISAGNMAQAVASLGKELNIPVKAIVPVSAPRAKTDVISTFGAEIDLRPMADIWNLIENPSAARDSLLIHPLVTPGILAGYGVIALEILDMAVRPDALFIPFGVGGLTIGIASILKKLAPDIPIYCVEAEACPTLQSAFRSDRPVYVEKAPTCADAIGTPRVVADLFELLNDMMLVHGVVAVPEHQIRSAMASLYLNHHVKTEGAAAACFAAAANSNFMRPMALLTGQNINVDLFNTIISESAPWPSLK